MSNKDLESSPYLSSTDVLTGRVGFEEMIPAVERAIFDRRLKPFDVGGCVQVYEVEDVPGILVKEFNRVADHVMATKFEDYDLEMFTREVADPTMLLQTPELGLVPFMPPMFPLWIDGVGGKGKGYIVTEKVESVAEDRLYSGWYRNDDIARQLDSLVAACLLVPAKSADVVTTYMLRPDIFHYRDPYPPVKVSIKNIIVGRLADADPTAQAQPYLVDSHPAVVLPYLTLEQHRILIGEGIYNLSKGGYDFPKSRVAAKEAVEFMQDHWPKERS